ncbi:MAG: hypothetical protein GWN58_58670 [Anaerolineae bacterium]|nr:hypothetical protein [Anaerolineae bacterium]
MAVSFPDLAVPGRIQQPDEPANLIQDGFRGSLLQAQAALAHTLLKTWAAGVRYQEGELVYLDNVVWRANEDFESAAVFVDDISSWDAVSVGMPLAAETERAVGKDWVDGNPIYDGGFQITLISSPGTTTQAHNISNLDVASQWTEILGAAVSSTPRAFALDGNAPGSGVGVSCYVDGSNFVLVHADATHNDQVFNLILRYQKT